MIHQAYRGMIVGKGIVDRHVFKEPPDVSVEEALDFLVIELRVDEHGADVSFRYVREVLQLYVSICI